MTVGELLDRGREAFAGRLWADAHKLLCAADCEVPLAVEDLERRAVAAHLVGRDDECDEIWVRAHHECRTRGDVALQRADHARTYEALRGAAEST